MERDVVIFDTTLRDGEQAPGNSMTPEEKLRLARQLDVLGVDVIETGFPAASDGDFRGVRGVAQEVRRPVIAALARCHERDIDLAGEALRPAERSRVHVFIATSDIHLQHKLRISKDECLDRARASVRRARQFTNDVEFSAEDASRSDLDFLCRTVEAAIQEGATTINLPDTVGYAMPSEYGAMFRKVRERVPNSDKVVFSAHCHDDLGLAVANSLAAIDAGAGQVECTVNGIGERAGNASLEEIVMAIRVRGNALGAETGIDPSQIGAASRLVERLTGYDVPRNKAIVGANAFAHEAGIHQDGLLKDVATYQIMDPAELGLAMTLPLGKHSGRHAFARACHAAGLSLVAEELDAGFRRFKELADSGAPVSIHDVFQEVRA